MFKKIIETIKRYYILFIAKPPYPLVKTVNSLDYIKSIYGTFLNVDKLKEQILNGKTNKIHTRGMAIHIIIAIIIACLCILANILPLIVRYIILIGIFADLILVTLFHIFTTKLFISIAYYIDEVGLDIFDTEAVNEYLKDYQFTEKDKLFYTDIKTNDLSLENERKVVYFESLITFNVICGVFLLLIIFIPSMVLIVKIILSSIIIFITLVINMLFKSIIKKSKDKTKPEDR